MQLFGENRWKIAVGLFFLGWVVLFMGRMALNPVQTLIRDEMALTNADVGLLTSVFYLLYTAMQIPAGMLGDRFGKTLIICLCFLIAGVFTGVTAISVTFTVLLLARALCGFGQGLFYGPQYALSSQVIPVRYRATGMAIIGSGTAVGITLGLAVASWLTFDLNLHWRMSFWLLTVPTLALGLAIPLLVKEPKKVAPVSSENKGVQACGEEKSLFSRNLCLIYYMIFCSLYAFFMMCTWLPVYLEEVRMISPSQTGFLSSLIAWTSVIPSLIVARIADKTGQRRRILMVLFPVAAAAIVWFLSTESYSLMVVSLIVYGIFGKITVDPVSISLVAENAPSSKISTVFGIYNFAGIMSAVIAPYVTGWLRDITGSWDIGFYVAAVLLFTATVAIWFIQEKE